MDSLAPSVSAAFLLAFVTAGGMAFGQSAPAWQEGFEGDRPSWREAGGDVPHRLAVHQRLRGEAHSGQGCEWLRIEAGQGSHLYIAHDIGQPRIIDDLVPSVWVKSDQSGVALIARIILPNTTDPRTGRPLATLVAGGAYSDVGRWQQLRIEQIPHLLMRQVHLLRMEHGSRVDERGAYVDALLLNVYGRPGTTNVWIDDIEVAGHVPLNATAPDSDNPATSSLAPVRLPSIGDGGNSPKHAVKLAGSILFVDGRPMFPRIIEHRGEPLETLKQMGFNAVWLRRLPAPEVLEEADRLGLWLICPPPRPVGGDTASQASLADIGPRFDCVLAWDLGGDLTPSDLESTRVWAEQVRAADRRGHRPLICRPKTDLRGFSRPANILLVDRRPVGTSLELGAYAEWIRQQPLLASLGTPLWTTVETQPNAAVGEQLRAIEPGASVPSAISPEQIRLLAYTAVAAGSRGLMFASDSPLDAQDSDSRQRAMSLELLNLELELIEPWAAAGSFVASAEASVPEVSGAVLRTEHSRLVLPIWSAPGAQFVAPQSAARALSLVAPGVPEASAAYELTPQGVHSLKHERVAGGMRITFDEFGLTSQVLVAHDPLVIEAVNRRAATKGRRAAELQRHLAVHQLNTVQAIAGQLAARTPVAAAGSWFDAARKSLQLCDTQLASGDAANAALNAQRAARSLRLIERAYWDATVRGLASPVTSPAAVSFETLVNHWRLIDRLRATPIGPNRLYGGDFEDIGVMQQAGWRFIQQAAPTVRTAVDLVPEAAHSGRLGLRLGVAAADPQKPPAAIEQPPVLFVSPAVQVEAGQLVCIHGWVRVPKAITGSADGLMVVDSLSGESLADRIGRTPGWRQFALYRAAPRSGVMYVTFALSGLGEAWLDDVEIQVLQ